MPHVGAAEQEQRCCDRGEVWVPHLRYPPYLDRRVPLVKSLRLKLLCF